MSVMDLGDAILRAAGANDCPAWCARHHVGEDSTLIHSGSVTVGAVTVDLEQYGDGRRDGVTDADLPGATVVLDNGDINGQTLDDYIAALTTAADLIRPHGEVR